MLSYWEKSSFLEADIVIIGGGIVGLSTAISLKEKDNKRSIILLEKGLFPSGASTKNAGFACIGSLSEIVSDLTTSSPDEVLELIALRYQGLKKLRQRLGDTTIGYAENGSYELFFEEQPSCINEIDNLNDWLLPLLGQKAFSLSQAKPSDLGLDSQKIKLMLTNNCEGEIHTGMMMKALQLKAQQMGISMFTQTEVSTIEDNGTNVKTYIQGSEVVFSSKKVIVCTNGFTSQFFPQLDINPGRGLVLITKAVEGLKLKGIFHVDEGYYYFREINGRVLLGGGRNLDKATEQTTQQGINPLINERLEEMLSNVILPYHAYEIDYKWVGIMAFGKDKQPITTFNTQNVYVAAHMGGMGVAIGSAIGEKVAREVFQTI
jgi:glycine/D-amino acid oxidase-like deaminating enzyme